MHNPIAATTMTSRRDEEERAQQRQQQDRPERQDGSPNNDDAIERIESQRTEEERSIAGLRDDWHMELSGDPSSAMVRLILLFSGVAPPPSWHSPWMLCRIGWPLILAFAATSEVTYVINRFENNDAVAAYIVDFPALLGIFAALGSYWWLWPKAHRLIAEEAPLPPEQLKGVVKTSGGYIVVWLTFGLVLYEWRAASGALKGFYFYGVISAATIEWIHFICIVPALGATLLVLGMETTHATNTIKGLLQAAENKTLTRSMYTTARDRIYGRSTSWKWSLGLLAVIALFNTIGLIIILHSPQLDVFFGTTIQDRIQEDLLFVVFLGKETALLFTILMLVVQVNNYADSITTVLNNEPWGELGSKEENARLDLLHLTTEYSITPEAAASMWKSFTTPTRKPISFRVCAIRPARNEFTAAVISLVGSVVGSLLQSYMYAGV